MEKIHLLNRNKVHCVLDVEAVISCCPVCLYMARDNYDLVSIEKEGACCECTTNFKYLNLDDWNHGVRPSTEEARKKILVEIGEI